VQSTVVVPKGNVAPDAGVHVTDTLFPSTVSVAPGVVKVTDTPPGPVASLVMSAGGSPTFGGVVSTTLTVKDADELLVCESDAVQVTVCGPRPRVAPEAGEQLTGTEPSTASFAEAEYVTTAPEALVASTEELAGTEMMGPVESHGPTVTLNEAVEVLL
jgi:hypothetical protein